MAHMSFWPGCLYYVIYYVNHSNTVPLCTCIAYFLMSKDDYNKVKFVIVILVYNNLQHIHTQCLGPIPICPAITMGAELLYVPYS